MAAMRGPRLQVGSTSWITEERSSALRIAQSEVEEFSFSARNELDWLNEHMAGVFDENEINIAENFKTPGKLRGKTPRTARRANPAEARQPLSDVFAATPNAPISRFAQKLDRVQSPQLRLDSSKGSPSPRKPASPKRHVLSPKPNKSWAVAQDSGYHGSQDMDFVDVHEDPRGDDLQQDPSLVALHTTTTVPTKQSPSHTPNGDSPEKTFQTAKEEQTARVSADAAAKVATPLSVDPPNEPSHARESLSGGTTPQNAGSPRTASPGHLLNNTNASDSAGSHAQDTGTPADDVRSTSDGSSPIRPMVRKSSLNFASLPAREPLTAGKSMGAHASRTSHLDHNRTSYYGRPTGGKSLGNHGRNLADDENEDEMEIDGRADALHQAERDNVAFNHHKTYTQRLQDQISMLSKSQLKPSGPSKLVLNAPPTKQNNTILIQPAEVPKSPSPKKTESFKTTPGAFPEDDDEEDWIVPPSAAPVTETTASPRPAFPKSHSADVMEGIHGKDTISRPDFDSSEHGSTSGENRKHGHRMSDSTSMLPSMASIMEADSLPLTKAATVSNPNFATIAEIDRSETPSKSSSRAFRDSPLRQVKNKLSSILKSSRGLLASSAAISAEGKSSLLSPSMTRLGFHPTPSAESIIPKHRLELQRLQAEDQTVEQEASSARPVARRTRASAEREKEEKRLDKEAKRLEEQMQKLEKLREKERDKARAFSQEQEKVAAMEQKMTIKKTEEKLLPKETPKPTRSSPRKAKAPQESVAKSADQDVEMTDAPATGALPCPPSSADRGHGTRKEIKRPLKPAKETLARPKQAPTVIRVNTGSQHSQYHSSAAGMPTNNSDNLASSGPQPQMQQATKASKASLHTKTSTQSLKGSASVGRPKALDLAAKKKEQDERDAQRRRDAKAEMERKRAVAQEEQRRQDQLRRQEADRQKQQKEREQATQADAKKNAQRQAAIEKAKQTRAPPPAVRSQPNGPPDLTLGHDKAASLSQTRDGPARPPSRMTSGIQRSQEDLNQSINAVLSNAPKAGTKRTLAPDNHDDAQSKRPASRGGPAYQAKDAKRRRTSENFEDKREADNPPNIKGPPVRPSGGFKKDLPTKSMFQNGYANVPQSATRDLFKATVTAQHSSQAKAAHPLDMAQISKGAIPFAPNANPAGPAYKTPARIATVNGAKSAAKSAAKSSPRFQNGELIELPEIQTDDEDEDDDDAHGMVAAWADSPDLRRALMLQETMDPSQIFGPPAPLNMEEVFSKSKDRWHKFRARTSSANWSGSDRLTEDEIRKDLAARDKLRREGGWSYEMSKDMI